MPLCQLINIEKYIYIKKPYQQDDQSDKDLTRNKRARNWLGQLYVYSDQCVWCNISINMYALRCGGNLMCGQWVLSGWADHKAISAENPRHPQILHMCHVRCRGNQCVLPHPVSTKQCVLLQGRWAKRCGFQQVSASNGAITYIRLFSKINRFQP